MMDLKKIATLKLRECDLIREDIYSLTQKEQRIRLEISTIKRAIENENSHLIGREAYCSFDTEKNFQNVTCVCTAVRCGDDFTAIPLFSFNGKKVPVNSYRWK